MGHILHTTDNLISYISPTLLENWLYKLTLGGFFVLLDTAFDTHGFLLTIFFVLFFLDLITGVLKAMKFNVFSSRAFFKGASKLLVYGVFIAVAESIDVSTGLDVFLPLMIAYIIHTDAVSILENIETLGFKQARPIRLVLQVYKAKFVKDNVPFLSKAVDIERDISKMKSTYIPMIPDKTNRQMFTLKIGILEKFLNDVSELDTQDMETFKTQFQMLLGAIGPSIEVELDKQNFNKKEIELFLTRHYKRVAQYKEELSKLYELEKKESDAVSHLKNNILQATVRIIYAGISDQIDVGIEYTKN